MIERVETLAGLDEVVALSGKRFFEEGQIVGSFVPEIFRDNWTRMLSAGIGAMWVSRQNGIATGALGAIIYPDVNDNELVATEAFWYVLPEHRGKMDSIRLFQHFEKWAMTREANRILMVHYLNTGSDKLVSFYQRNGYRSIETFFVKEVKSQWQ